MEADCAFPNRPGRILQIKCFGWIGTSFLQILDDQIGGKQIEIKPMKLIYQRNRTAVFYHVLDSYPLPDILAMDNPFQDGRDGDKALFDWLVAATDDEELITEHYNEIDSGTIYKILEIFRRVNKIDEMEERAKNVEAPRAKKRG